MTWHPQGVPLHFTHQNKVEPLRTKQEQKRQFQEVPLSVSQTKNSTTSGGPAPYIDLPQRLTLPFSLHTERDSEVSGRQANSNGLLRRARPISDPALSEASLSSGRNGLLRRARLIAHPYVEQHRPPVPASILAEDIV